MNRLPEGLHGYCDQCKKEHRLPAGNSKKYCLELMQRLEYDKRLDFLSPAPGIPQHRTSNLFGEARGKMFGVLEGVDKDGNIIILHSFSGQFNGCWNVPGWVGPLFDVGQWQSSTVTTEKKIKNIGKEMSTLSQGSNTYQKLKQQRKKLSQNLMGTIHSLYELTNFRGQTASLTPFFPINRGIPTGTGDCCGPKLLNHAIHNDITPFGISEFYWGRTNRSGTKHHGHFYPACLDKCYPLMGFMLCGLNN